MKSANRKFGPMVWHPVWDQLTKGDQAAALEAMKQYVLAEHEATCVRRIISYTPGSSILYDESWVYAPQHIAIGKRPENTTTVRKDGDTSYAHVTGQRIRQIYERLNHPQYLKKTQTALDIILKDAIYNWLRSNQLVTEDPEMEAHKKSSHGEFLLTSAGIAWLGLQQVTEDGDISSFDDQDSAFTALNSGVLEGLDVPDDLCDPEMEGTLRSILGTNANFVEDLDPVRNTRSESVLSDIVTLKNGDKLALCTSENGEEEMVGGGASFMRLTTPEFPEGLEDGETEGDVRGEDLKDERTSI